MKRYLKVDKSFHFLGFYYWQYFKRWSIWVVLTVCVGSLVACGSKPIKQIDHKGSRNGSKTKIFNRAARSMCHYEVRGNKKFNHEQATRFCDRNWNRIALSLVKNKALPKGSKASDVVKYIIKQES